MDHETENNSDVLLPDSENQTQNNDERTTTELQTQSAIAVDDSTKNSTSKDPDEEVEDSKDDRAELIHRTTHFEWKGVNVTIEGKQILHNINGSVTSGHLLAILGGSGAGKTTLLNAISGRILSKTPSAISSVCCIPKCKSSGTQVNGTVAYKGSKYALGSSDHIKYISAYVMQSDIMCATATGQEALTFSSGLRSIKSPEEQQRIINHVVDSLKLKECNDTRVGNEAIRGMSGGEKKRTSVGVELVTEPELIFLDEPTSGLDSFTALKTMEILKDLTEKDKKQVVATIHQPSSEIFDMIDSLILLAQGHIVYYGPSSGVLEYFGNLGYKCPQYSNIADYIVNRVQENSEFFVDKWKEHEKQYIDLNFNDYDVLQPKRKQTAPFCKQFGSVLKREFQILTRDPRPSKIRFVQTIVFSLFVGILYNSLPYTPEGLRDRFGAIFFLTINSSMTGLISTIIVFPEQRLLFERERDANMYYTTTWLLAKLLISIPEHALFTLIYLLIAFWMVGFDSPFFSLYISLVLCVLCTGSFGMIIGCFAKNVGEAMQMMPMGFIPFLLFTNFLVSLEQIPAWIRWIQWLNPFKYIVDAVCLTEFQDQLHDWGCQYHPASNQEICDYWYDGNAYLEQIDAGCLDTNWLKDWLFEYQDCVYFDWVMLFILLVLFRLITWIILVRRNGW
eukprot:351218_1